MKIVVVSVTYGETRSINYQSARVDIGLTAAINEGELPEDVQRDLEKKCVAIVNEAFLRHNMRKAGG